MFLFYLIDSYDVLCEHPIKLVRYREDYQMVMKISILQQGQCELNSSHGTKQLEWNLWAQDNCMRLSLFLYWSKQMAHSSCSNKDFHPSFAQLINLFDTLFFNLNTSLCKSLIPNIGLISTNPCLCGLLLIVLLDSIATNKICNQWQVR